MRAVYFILIFSSFVFSQRQLSLEEAILYARKHNPQINQLRENISEQKGVWWSSMGIYDPVFSIMKEGIALGDHSGFAEKRWTISQSIDFPLTSYFRLQGISQQENALHNQLKANCLSLKRDVKKAYLELVYKNQIILLRREQLGLADNLLNSALMRVELGEASHLDLLKAEIAKAESENDLETAGHNYDISLRNFYTLIGLSEEERDIFVAMPDSFNYKPIDISRESLIAGIRIQPLFTSLNNRVNAAQSGVQQAWSKFLPNFNFAYYEEDFGTGLNYYGYEVGINIPLWFFLNQRGEIQQAKAIRNQMQWKMQEVYLGLERKIESSWQSYLKSQSVIQRYHDLVRVRAQSLRDLTQEAYQAGEINLLALLEGQRTYLESEKRYYDALQEYYGVILDLEQVLQKDMIMVSEEILCEK